MMKVQRHQQVDGDADAMVIIMTPLLLHLWRIITIIMMVMLMMTSQQNNVDADDYTNDDGNDDDGNGDDDDDDDDGDDDDNADDGDDDGDEKHVLTKIGFRHSTLRRSRDSKAQDDISVDFPNLR